MPRPPILPLIDWQTVHADGLGYDEWLQAAENPEHRERMEAIFESVELEPADLAWLAALQRDVHVVAIAEDWCGDVVRHAPVLGALAAKAPRLKLSFIRRDWRPDVFARFLTNGGEAIPKFVFLSQDFVECGNWGPMPNELRRIISRGKACGDVGAARERVSKSYESDPRYEVVISELLDLVEIAACSKP